MNHVNTERLFRAFPVLYRDRAAPITQSLMAFGFECGDGWVELLYNLSEALTEHAGKAGLDIVATQVKEKWGELVVYVDGTDDEAYRLIEVAQEASAKICEVCGAPGRLYARGWRQTRCLAHAPEDQASSRHLQ